MIFYFVFFFTKIFKNLFTLKFDFFCDLIFDFFLVSVGFLRFKRKAKSIFEK